MSESSISPPIKNKDTAPITTVTTEVPQQGGDASSSGVAVGGKRPRRGEGTISDPSTISLHHTDFVWGAMFLGEGKSIMTTPTDDINEDQSVDTATSFATNKAFLEAYLKTMLGKLEQVKQHPIQLVRCQSATDSGVVDDIPPIPSSSSSMPTTINPTPSQPKESTAWEEHYTRNLNQFFPYKNYLVKAFPDLESIIVSSIADANYKVSGRGDGAVEEGGDVVCNNNGNNNVCALPPKQQSPPIIVMECGCGTGSALLPIIHFTTPATARFIAFDISPKAVEVFQQHTMVKEYLSRPWGPALPLQRSEVLDPSPSCAGASAFIAFPYNISTRGANLDEEFVQRRFLEHQQKQHPQTTPSSSLISSPWVPQSVDLLLLIFTLCAMESVADMHLALRRLHYWLRPGKWTTANDDGASGNVTPPVWKGGKLLFRDYGMFDHNMFRFGSKSASAECNLAEGELFCKKADGTSQFFFDVNFTKALFEAAGFVCLKLDYHCNTVKNRKTGVSMHKVFVNGEFGVLQQQKQ